MAGCARTGHAGLPGWMIPVGSLEPQPAQMRSVIPVEVEVCQTLSGLLQLSLLPEQ